MAWICALSAVRGAGFAVLTVLGATLAAQVAPPERRGESIGLYGLAIAVPNLIAVPAGVALVLDGHVGLAVLAGRLPGPRRRSWSRRSCASMAPQPGPGPAGTGRAAVLRRAGAVRWCCSSSTLAGGGLVTFLPIERPDGVLATAALLLFGVDRRGHPLARRAARRPAGQPAAAAARPGRRRRRAGRSPPSGWWPGAAWVLVGAAVFGAGYGATQNLTLLAAFARAGEGGTTTASAMWNASFDAGTADRRAGARLPRRGDRAGLDLRAGRRRCWRRRVPLASAAARAAVRA